MTLQVINKATREIVIIINGDKIKMDCYNRIKICNADDNLIAGIVIDDNEQRVEIFEDKKGVIK